MNFLYVYGACILIDFSKNKQYLSILSYHVYIKIQFYIKSIFIISQF